MSEVTLQRLMADFEAARMIVDSASRKDIISYRKNTTHRYEWMEEIERCATSFGGGIPNWTGPLRHAMKQAIEAARRYVIARDFHEYNPERADMLWKLRNQ